MRYAATKCTATTDGENVTITGPYFDDPTRTRSVVVKEADLKSYESGEKKYVQTAFPYLSTDDREFLISGMSPEGWDKAFPLDDN